MPTAGKLTAAVLFMALAFYITTLCAPIFPEGTAPKFLYEINVGAGLLMGWIVAGSRAGTGYNAAIGYGITTVAAIAFWGLFGNSFVEMIDRSLNHRYDGPMEAVVSVFQLGIDTGALLGTPEVVGTFLAGGIIAGLLTDFIGQRFP